MGDGGLEPDLRALLVQHGVEQGGSDALLEAGITSIDHLYHLGKDAVDDLLDNLERLGVPGKSVRLFQHWLDARGPVPPIVARTQSTRVNDDDTSGIEDATILRVDIDPESQDLSNMLRIPAAAISRQVQQASGGYVPVVSFLGPTGAGKSFAASMFMDPTAPKRQYPLVAKADQHVPTSAHVCAYRGGIRSPQGGDQPILMMDFEGEDGRTPRLLEEPLLRRLAQGAHGFAPEALLKLFLETSERRSHIVKALLPCIAYLSSDVIVFADTVVLHRTDKPARIKSFAEEVHKAVPSLRWKPVLVILQNRSPVPKSGVARYNISDEKTLQDLYTDLKEFFSHIEIFQLPNSTGFAGFDIALSDLHATVARAVEVVRGRRSSVSDLPAEVDFWFGFDSLVQQLRLLGTGKLLDLPTLSDILKQNKLASRSGLDNVAYVFRKLRASQEINFDFFGCVADVLQWYAYAIAGTRRV